ncbi:MAG: HAMP domain-containing histidine kinase [Leptospirales bacterium]|nr:HAMP domain-containing histidine kinase [Leptospirales bacterium]
MILFRFVQVVLILGFSAGILFLAYSWFVYLSARSARVQVLRRMNGPFPRGTRAQVFHFVFSPILYVEFEREGSFIILEKRFGLRRRSTIKQSAAGLLGQFEPIISEWIRSGLPVAAIPAEIIRGDGLRCSICLFNLTGSSVERSLYALVLMPGRHLPSLEELTVFRSRVIRDLPALEARQKDISLADMKQQSKKGRTDLSRRALLAEAELESQRLAMLQIAHDIRIPVAALRLIRINLAAEWEAIRPQLSVPNVHMDGLIGRLGKQLSNLELFASSYLDLETSSGPATAPTSPEQEVELNVLWLELLDAHAEELKSKRLQLKLEGTWESHRVFGHRESLIRILENVLSNAIKFSVPGGMIWTSLKRDQQMSVLELEDSGPGMPVDEQEIHFELATRNIGRSGSGYGLGLAAARKLAKHLHGSLISAPPTHGHGARLVLMLPLPPD